MQDGTSLTARTHIMNITAHSMLPSSSDAVALRCRSQDIASVSGRAPRTQLSIRRSPLQLPHAQRRPSLAAAARCSRSPAEQSQQIEQLRSPPAPLLRLSAVQILQASVPLWMLTAAPVLAADADFAQSSASQGSYYATLFLFVSTIPGTICCLIALFVDIHVSTTFKLGFHQTGRVVTAHDECCLQWSAAALLLPVSCQQRAPLADVMAGG